ncbi:MAG: hypothetical protein V2A69_04830 [Pseudomonadota bacterium]
MDESKIKSIILDITEASLEAQLRAVRRIKSGEETTKTRPRRKSMSQVDMAYDILQKAGTPLHISEIIARIEQHHGQRLDRESLVSALVKKVQRQDRFVRTDKNVFGLIESGR